MSTPDKQSVRASQLISDLAISEYLGEIDIDGFGNLTKLDASALKSNDADAKAQRFALIDHVNSGKHLELAVTAQTYAQTKKPNRRYLRFADDQLEAAPPTWKGQPYLVDHNTWSMRSAMGTILSSKAVQIAGGTAFEQKLHAVKRDAVIGILDGTFSKFSIGWWPLGTVLCSIHGCDVQKLDSCNCWPGDHVKLDDGRERIAEYIFTKVGGKETSSVVIPAVQDTHVDEVRAALAAELQITRPQRTTIATPRVKETKMLFHRLAVALGLTALSEADEDRALAAVSALQARANAAETRATLAETKLTKAEEAIETLTASAVGSQIEAALRHDGYAAGKLRYGRDAEGKATPSPMEAFLRDLGTKGGVNTLKLQLAQMPEIVPVGKRPQAESAKEPDRTELGAADDLTVDNPYIKHAAELTGQKPEDLVAFAKGHVSASPSEGY